MRQERLEKIVKIARYGIITAIGAGTLAAALFSGCSSNFSKKNEPKSSDEKKQEDPRLVGPELFDPRINMGMPSSESVYAELLELAKIYQAPIPSSRTSDYQNTVKPVSQPTPQSQQLQEIQKPRTDDYQPRMTNPDYQTPIATPQQASGYQKHTKS